MGARHEREDNLKDWKKYRKPRKKYTRDAYNNYLKELDYDKPKMLNNKENIGEIEDFF